MKTKLLFTELMLLALFCNAQQSSEIETKANKYLSTVEIGPGFNVDPDKIAILRTEYSTGLSPVIALSTEYRLGFDKSSLEFHQVAIKLGPYLRIGEWSYAMLSAGVAFYLSPSSKMFSAYNTPQYVPLVAALKQNSSLFALPVQAKLSFPLYHQVGLGAEFSHYFCSKKSVDDWSLFSLFISFQLANSH